MKMKRIANLLIILTLISLTTNAQRFTRLFIEADSVFNEKLQLNITKMQINTRYNIGQLVFYMKDNKVATGTISTIEVEIKGMSDSQNAKCKTITIKYGLYLGNLPSKDAPFYETSLFPTKKGLLESLKN